jgi:hypothetical protein
LSLRGSGVENCTRYLCLAELHPRALSFWSDRAKKRVLRARPQRPVFQGRLLQVQLCGAGDGKVFTAGSVRNAATQTASDSAERCDLRIGVLYLIFGLRAMGSFRLSSRRPFLSGYSDGFLLLALQEVCIGFKLWIHTRRPGCRLRAQLPILAVGRPEGIGGLQEL